MLLIKSSSSALPRDWQTSFIWGQTAYLKWFARKVLGRMLWANVVNRVNVCMSDASKPEAASPVPPPGSGRRRCPERLGTRLCPSGTVWIRRTPPPASVVPVYVVTDMPREANTSRRPVNPSVSFWQTWCLLWFLDVQNSQPRLIRESI